MNLEARLDQLYRDLEPKSYGDNGAFFEGTTVSREVIEVFNVLLVHAKEAKPDDPVLASLDALRDPPSGGSLRILVAQIRLAVNDG